MGLIIHRFHIRRRDDGEKKKAPKKGKGRPDDYSDWCVHCDVCDKPNSLVSSFRSNPPLYIFQTQHLGLANHLANGQRLLSSMDNAAEVTKRDDAAAAALRAFERVGYQCYLSPSSWRLGVDDAALVHRLVEGWAEAAKEILPQESDRISAWADRRSEVVSERRFMLTVGHDDLLALPRDSA